MTTGPNIVRETPGVYVTELSAFAPSVVGVATAAPIFIGYTETARDPSTGQSLYLQAVPISSLDDYCTYFGHGSRAQGVVVPLLPASTLPSLETAEPLPATPAPGTIEQSALEAVPVPAQPPDPIRVGDFVAASSDGVEVQTIPFVVGTAQTTFGELSFVPQFNLFQALQMFYANGGGDCFVISVANYQGTQDISPPAATTAPAAVSRDALLAGLAVAQDTRGGSMLVVPEACMLFDISTSNGVTRYTYEDYAAVAVEMINQAGALQDRMAILDLPGALIPENRTFDALQEMANAFYTAIAPAVPGFSYGTCYGPAIATSLLRKSDVTYASLKGSAQSTTLMNNLLTTQALDLFSQTRGVPSTTYSSAFVEIAAHIAAAFPVSPADATWTANMPIGTTGVTRTTPGLLVSMTPTSTPPLVAVPATEAETEALDNYLMSALPLFGTIKQILADKLNVAPPSGAIAGVWSQTDALNGVWNAPANVSVNCAVKPLVQLTDVQQGGFNAPPNGNAINVLRAFTNRGTVVWGARTLDGNSLDLRLIQVRRTLIYIEQSIKSALQQFVFAPNDATTWATAVAMVSSFLTQLWQQGGLMGSKASEAFTVSCGLGSTMTSQDVLDGYMNMSVSLQLIHPAEFIELAFQQVMQDS